MRYRGEHTLKDVGKTFSSYYKLYNILNLLLFNELFAKHGNDPIIT